MNTIKDLRKLIYENGDSLLEKLKQNYSEKDFTPIRYSDYPIDRAGFDIHYLITENSGILTKIFRKRIAQLSLSSTRGIQIDTATVTIFDDQLEPEINRIVTQINSINIEKNTGITYTTRINYK